MLCTWNWYKLYLNLKIMKTALEKYCFNCFPTKGKIFWTKSRMLWKALLCENLNVHWTGPSWFHCSSFYSVLLFLKSTCFTLIFLLQCTALLLLNLFKLCLTVYDLANSHGLQHTRLLGPPLSPGVCSNSCPLSWWCYQTISPSIPL